MSSPFGVFFEGYAFKENPEGGVKCHQQCCETLQLNNKNICVENSILNADKGFDSKRFRRAIMRRNMVPNIKENTRNRKTKKRGKKRFYNNEIYKTRFVNERCFAWIDSFRTLLVRFDKIDKHWLDWHYLAFALILMKV